MRYLLVASILLVGAASIASAEPLFPVYEVAGLPMTRHQVCLLGALLRAGEVRERAPEAMLMMSGMPASPHPAAALTPRPEEIQIAKKH